MCVCELAFFVHIFLSCFNKSFLVGGCGWGEDELVRLVWWLQSWGRRRREEEAEMSYVDLKGGEGERKRQEGEEGEEREEWK